jgi:hypothetical protein
MIRLAARRYNEGAHDAAFEYFLPFHYHAPFVFGIHYRRHLTRSHRMSIMVALLFKEVS